MAGPAAPLHECEPILDRRITHRDRFPLDVRGGMQDRLPDDLFGLVLRKADDDAVRVSHPYVIQLTQLIKCQLFCATSSGLLDETLKSPQSFLFDSQNESTRYRLLLATSGAIDVWGSTRADRDSTYLG
jgi:hypothetical protein